MSLFRKFANERDGSILPLFGILIMLLLAVVTIGIDMSQTFGERTRLQTAADMAAVQTGRALKDETITIAQAQAYAKDAFNRIASGLSANGDGSSGSSLFGTMTVKPAVEVIERVEGKSTTYLVKVKGTAKIPASPLSFMFFDEETGKNTISLGFESETTTKEEAGVTISMALVLDRSGSMGSKPWQCYYPHRYDLTNYDCNTRMGSLKKAVADLVKELKEVDPDEQYIRLGAYAYHSRYAGRKAMTWAKDTVKNWVYTLRASGGTRAYTALRPAYNDLTSLNEKTQHEKKSGEEPKLFMVYMTDGADHSVGSAKAECRKAKKAGIEIYTVAFQAPNSGKALLQYCASSSKHYYDAKNAADLAKAFRDIAREASDNIPFVSG